MSVWCCSVPDFLIGLEYRRQPKLRERPLALLGPEERVLAVSPDARASGVYLDMPPRQAQTRCPDIVLRHLDMQKCAAEQRVLIGALAECGLPVEAYTWGKAYVDLRAVATTSQSVKPILVEMGKQVRRLLGESLPATGGWDTGKFTAQAAANSAKPDHIVLVDRATEVKFLNPLSVTLLPLPVSTLQELYWLGIRTLGQFAHLPATEVWRRFGQMGKVAQRWAKGLDDRPVCPNAKVIPQPASIDFDPPTALHTHVLEATLAKIGPQLVELGKQLEGCRRLRLELAFANHETRDIDCAFVDPVSDGSRLRATLSHQFQTLNWPAELETLRITLLESGELVTRQLTLFDTDEDRSPLIELAQKLSVRHGSIFFQARLTDEHHPLAERRVTLNTLLANASL